MVTYTVFYRKDGLLGRWKKLKSVKGDGFTETNTHRFFVLEDETRMEIPLKEYSFKFSNERFILIKQRMGNEAGQDIRIDER